MFIIYGLRFGVTDSFLGLRVIMYSLGFMIMIRVGGLESKGYDLGFRG